VHQASLIVLSAEIFNQTILPELHHIRPVPKKQTVGTYWSRNFYWRNALPAVQPTASKKWRE